MKTPHTHYPKGSHVHVTLRDGSKIDDIFEDHLSGVIVLRKYGRVRLRNVRAMSFRKLRDAANTKTS